MKKKDLLMVGLIILNMALLIDKFGTRIISIAYAQNTEAETPKEKYDIEVGKMLANRIDVAEINTNKVRIYGYDMLKLNEKLMNLLASKGVISYKEAQSIIDSSKELSKQEKGK